MSTLHKMTPQEREQYSPREHQAMVERALFEKELAGKVGTALMIAYPGYDWHIEVESRAGMVHVRNLALNGQWGYDVHLQRVLAEDGMRQCVMAAGEILERYSVSRDKRKDGEVESLTRDLRGNAIGDHAAA